MKKFLLLFIAGWMFTHCRGQKVVISTNSPQHTDTTFKVTTAGTGMVSSFSNQNNLSVKPVIDVNQVANVPAIKVKSISSSANSGAIESIITTGNGIYGKSDNGAGVLGLSTGNGGESIGVRGVSYSPSTACGSVTGLNGGDGIGVYGTSAGLNGFGIGVYGETNGTDGAGVKARAYSSDAYAVHALNTGGGISVFANSSGLHAWGISGIAQPTNGTFGVGVTGQSLGVGDGMRGFSGTNGYGVSGFASFDGTGSGGVYGEGNGNTYGVKGSNNSNSKASIYGVNGSGDGITGITNGSGYGVRGTAGTSGAGIYGSSAPATNTGRAALFETLASGNTYDAVRVNNAGLGAAMYLNSTNASNVVTMMKLTKSGTGDYMVMENGGGTNMIRFNNQGKGFFADGTQTGGADMAEVFDVEGNRNEYEPGDVLIISIDSDRTVTKSNSAYSSLIAGVYATKPGVLMTEESIEADLSLKVPMGVLGVIPTKVCLEGGVIRRGDLIVTSSIEGVAMKADPEKIKPGQVLGKALENYSNDGIGKIKLLVNAK